MNAQQKIRKVGKVTLENGEPAWDATGSFDPAAKDLFRARRLLEEPNPYGAAGLMAKRITKIDKACRRMAACRHLAVIRPTERKTLLGLANIFERRVRKLVPETSTLAG